MGMGGCIVSKNLWANKGKLKWCFREKGQNEVDTGWRFLSDIDTDEFLKAPSNLLACNFESMIEIEPAVLSIYHLPVGTELIFVEKGKRRFFIDSNTKKEI